MLSSLQNLFLNPNSIWFFGYEALYLILASIVLAVRGERNLLSALFPREAYTGASAKVDYQWFVMMGFLRIGALGGFFYALADQGAAGIGHFFHLARSEHTPFLEQVIYTWVALLAMDLAYTFFHFSCHRIKFLWEFHKVHHAASHLTPFTNERVHPVERILEYAFVSFSLMMAAIGVALLQGHLPTGAAIYHVSLATLVFATIPHLNHFRHSHIWISYGRANYFLSSPAMHQIHHSVDRKHYDKNFCRLFPVFDLLLGTLYIPKSPESLRFGLEKEEWGKKRYDHFLGNLIGPFQSKKPMVLPSLELPQVHQDVAFE